MNVSNARWYPNLNASCYRREENVVMRKHDSKQATKRVKVGGRRRKDLKSEEIISWAFG